MTGPPPPPRRDDRIPRTTAATATGPTPPPPPPTPSAPPPPISQPSHPPAGPVAAPGKHVEGPVVPRSPHTPRHAANGFPQQLQHHLQPHHSHHHNHHNHYNHHHHHQQQQPQHQHFPRSPYGGPRPIPRRPRTQSPLQPQYGTARNGLARHEDKKKLPPTPSPQLSNQQNSPLHHQQQQQQQHQQRKVFSDGHNQQKQQQQQEDSHHQPPLQQSPQEPRTSQAPQNAQKAHQPPAPPAAPPPLPRFPAPQRFFGGPPRGGFGHAPRRGVDRIHDIGPGHGSGPGLGQGGSLLHHPPPPHSQHGHLPHPRPSPAPNLNHLSPHTPHYQNPHHHHQHQRYHHEPTFGRNHQHRPYGHRFLDHRQNLNIALAGRPRSPIGKHHPPGAPPAANNLHSQSRTPFIPKRKHPCEKNTNAPSLLPSTPRSIPVPRSQDDSPNMKAPDRSLVPQHDCSKEVALVSVSKEVASSTAGNRSAGSVGDSASRSPEARAFQSVATSVGVGVLAPAGNISQTGRPHRPKGVPVDVPSGARSGSNPRLAAGLAESTNLNTIVGSVHQNTYPPCDADIEPRSAKFTSAKSVSILAPLSATLQASRSASSPSLISSPQGLATGTSAVLVSRPVDDIRLDKVVQPEKTAPPQSVSVFDPAAQRTCAISAVESQPRPPNETPKELYYCPRDRHVSDMSPDKSSLTTQICGRSDISSSVRGADPKTSPRAIASPGQPSHPLSRVALSRPHPASPTTRPSPVDSIASILSRIANVDASIKRVDNQICELREKELFQQDVPSIMHSKMNRSEPAGGALPEMFEGESSDAASQARALLKRFEERQGGEEYSRKLLSPINQSILYILEQNRCRAASASGALRRLCSKPELGLDPAFVDEAPYASPVSDVVAEQVRQVLIDRRNMREVKKRELISEYLKHVGVWRVKTKQARDKRSRDKREICRERDRFLYRSIMGENFFLQARTSSGRTTTKVISGINSSGPVNYTAEIDASLAEIELQGGTPGSKEIWSRTLASIPEQRADIIPSDYGSILIEDPVREVHNRRAVNPWTREETFVFLDKFVLYPKNFKRIASFLEHKSFGDVVEFYYRNKLHLKLKFLAAKRKTIKRAYLLSLAGLRRAPESLKQRAGSAARSDDLKSPTLENRTVDPKIVCRQSYSPQLSEIGAAPDERMRSPRPSSARNGRVTDLSSCRGNDLNSSPIVGRATRAQVRDAETGERGISLDGLADHAKANELCVDRGIQEDSERGQGNTTKSAKPLKPAVAVLSPDQVHSNIVAAGKKVLNGWKLGKAEPHGAIEPEELETEPDISPEGKDLASEISLRRVAKQKMVVASTPVSPAIGITLCQSDLILDTADRLVKQAPECSSLSASMNRVGMSLGEVATRECQKAHASRSPVQVESSGQNDGVLRVEDLGCPERSVAVADGCTERVGSQTAAMSGEKGSRKLKTALWSSQEVCFFEKLFETYGRDWKKISAVMTSKSPAQVKGYWRRRGSDPKELNGSHEAPLGSETVAKQNVVVSRENDHGSEVHRLTSEDGGEPAKKGARTNFVLPVAATLSLSGASMEGSKSLSVGAPEVKIPQCSKGMSDESTDGGAQLTPSQRSRTVSQVMEPTQTETSSARVKTGSVAASMKASYVESSKAARRDDTGLESAAFSRIQDITGRKRDAKAADLEDLGGNGSKRDRSFSRAAAVQTVRAFETAESSLASRAMDGISESCRPIRQPVVSPGLLRSRAQQDASKASSMLLNLGIISQPACPIPSPNIAPDVIKCQPPSAPVAARSATIKLPKFRSMPLPSGSDGTPVAVPRSAPIPPSSPGKPGGSGPARPTLVAGRVPPNQPLTPHSVSQAGVSSGGLATPRSLGSSRLQELVNKARAAGFITKGS